MGHHRHRSGRKNWAKPNQKLSIHDIGVDTKTNKTLVDGEDVVDFDGEWTEDPGPSLADSVFPFIFHITPYIFYKCKNAPRITSRRVLPYDAFSGDGDSQQNRTFPSKKLPGYISNLSALALRLYFSWLLWRWIERTCNEAIKELFSFLEGKIGIFGGTNVYLGII